jgi:hypothetical protein
LSGVPTNVVAAPVPHMIEELVINNRCALKDAFVGWSEVTNSVIVPPCNELLPKEAERHLATKWLCRESCVNKNVASVYALASEHCHLSVLTYRGMIHLSLLRSTLSIADKVQRKRREPCDKDSLLGSLGQGCLDSFYATGAATDYDNCLPFTIQVVQLG